MRRSLLALMVLFHVSAIVGGEIEVRVRGKLVNPAPNDADQQRVLFIGNSLTYYNEMPWICEKVAESLGGTPRLRTFFAGRSGATLRQHWNDPRVMRSLREGSYAYVVLQPQSSEIIRTPDETLKYAKLLAGDARRLGAKTVVFQTWAPRGSSATQAQYNAAYAILARELGAIVAPVGEAWEKVRGEGIELFDGSGLHANLAGSYLSAAVFVSLFCERATTGAVHAFDVHFEIPEVYRSALENERLSPTKARLIQQAAWQAVRQAIHQVPTRLHDPARRPDLRLMPTGE